GERFHAVPPPYTGNNMPSRPNLSFAGLDDSVYKTKVSETETNISKTSKDIVEKRKIVRPSAPIIEDWDTNSDNDIKRVFNQKLAVKTYNLNEKVKTTRVNNVTTAGPKVVVSAVVGYGETAFKSSACCIWRPTGNVIDHTSKDSGSYMLKRFDYVDLQGRLKIKGFLTVGSRHMTGNKSFLTDYQEIDGGFVAFGGSPKGGKIIRKGKIRTGKLDFEDVYFVKELKFNLFSVSQMCDKKNSVLFTETECLVLSPDFKLLDESQVLLKVPRQNNMYSFDLKNVVPSGGLTCLFAKATIDESNLWHRRLGHINFKTMNKLVRGNLDETSGILKTFITGIENQTNHKVKIIRYDNGTEFKNNDMNQLCGMKGIKREFIVARTPQQNGVAERKNRTLIEAAKTMLVTILNTLDPLGKFDGKADEGFLVGYSINSKAFRVFNTRTRKVEENLHITFLENKPNVAGSGPDWLFDIDLLTNSMNYEPVTAGNQTNRNAGIKDNVDAVPTQQYILLPLLYDSPQSLEDAVADDAGKKTNEEPANEGERNGQEKEGGASNKEGDQNVQDFRAELDNLLVQQKEGYANSTNRVSTVSPSVSAVGQSFVNVDDLPTDPLMLDLEDTTNLLNTGIFSGAYDMKIIHKDHPKDQIIGDINSATQTRRMTKIFEEHAMVYVDDIIFGSTKKSLCTKFETQDKYVADILKKFDFVTMKTTSTLIETNKALLKDEEAKDVDVHLYRSMIGSLMYLIASRPDIMFAVCACARIVIMLGASLDRKSTTGGCQFLGKRLISWQCKKQTVVANSTTEAEYVAAANCCGQVLWIQNQMLDYGFNFMNTKIYIDNESTICIVKNPVFHSKTKHIEIRHHFIRDSYEKKLIQVIKIHTDHNVADLLTKAFDVSRKAKRTTEISQSSGPIPLVTDKTVIKEWEDRMERAASLCFCLEECRDSGNINRTQSMATLNEFFPQGADLGSGPRCQDTILGGAEAQTRFEAASKQSNDPPLSRVNTLRSGEDSMKLKELMEFCTKLSERALDL
ncbi:putative ribonuclease H-like domain-containing protein, partial [Tanacetum coccineum]